MEQDRLDNRTEWSPLILSVESLNGPLNWADVFKNDHPVEIEIGCGKGGFLVQSSQFFPRKNFVSLEESPKMVKYTAERLRKRGIANVRLVAVDAHYFLARFGQDSSITGVHLYFPDPWPKRQQRKRRILNGAFLEILQRVLRRGAFFYFATDNQEYFDYATDLFLRTPTFQALDPTDWVENRPSEAITNYEIKYRREGRPIYYALYRKNRE